MKESQNQQARRTGRPIIEAREGEKASFMIRAEPDLKRDLMAATKHTGASLSEECAKRLRRSFAEELAFGGRAGRDMVYLMAGAFRSAGRERAARKSPDLVEGDAWIRDADCYEAAMLAVLVQLAIAYPGSLDSQGASMFAAMLRSSLETRIRLREGSPFIAGDPT
jgi:hypothetical protein